MQEFHTLRCWIDARGIANVTLHRPEVHNAFDEQMIAELTEAFRRIEKDATVRVVVLRGEGKSFCAGADLSWMRKMKDFSEAENREDSRRLAAMFAAIDQCTRPVIARIHGAALGGGSGLAAVSDLVIAEEQARFGFTEVRLGIVPAVISPYVIGKIGAGHARATFLSGRRFSAASAVQMGLAHRMESGLDALEAALEQEVGEYLQAAPQATQHAKQLIRQISGRAVADVTEETIQTIASLRVSEEGQEGMAAVLEKRVPKWQE